MIGSPDRLDVVGPEDPVRCNDRHVRTKRGSNEHSVHGITVQFRQSVRGLGIFPGKRLLQIALTLEQGGKRRPRLPWP